MKLLWDLDAFDEATSVDLSSPRSLPSPGCRLKTF